jgi:hypothetical protein
MTEQIEDLRMTEQIEDLQVSEADAEQIKGGKIVNGKCPAYKVITPPSSLVRAA